MIPRFRKRRRRARQIPRDVYRPRRYLLTPNESAFFRVLRTLLGRRYLISCKVRLADLVTCSNDDWRRGHANRIAQKHVDFVVSCAESSRILLAIELDDRTHQRPDRRRRDLFVNQLCIEMDVPLVRIPSCWNYDRETIAGQLAGFGLDINEGD